jgi:hypothetical protein
MPWNIPFRSDPFPGNSVLDAYNSLIAILNDRLDGLDPANVRITGGTIDGTVIGGSVPAAGYFTTLQAGGDDVVTLNAVQTLTQKTLTSPDINGGTIDGAIINGSSIGLTTPAAGAFTSITLGTALAVADGGTGASNAADARANLGLAIGTNVQAWSAILDDLSALTAAADRLPYFDSASSAATTVFTAFARTLLDDADAAAMRTTLGLVIGTNVQAYDAALQSISGLANAANQIIYTTGTDTFANAPISAGGRALINTTGAANAVPYYTSASAASTFLTTASGRAFANLTTAADQLGYFTSASAAAVTALTASGRSLIGLTGATDQVPYFSAAATASLATLTSFARTLLDDADAATARSTLGLGTAATQNTGTSGGTIPLLNTANTWGGAQALNAGASFGNSALAGATTLDWYEEGSSTLSVVGTSTAGTATYATRVCNWVRIGQWLFGSFELNWSGGTGTGNLRVSGFPYTIDGTAGYQDSYVASYHLTLTANNVVIAEPSPGGTVFDFYQNPSGSVVAYDAAAILRCTFKYKIA